MGRKFKIFTIIFAILYGIYLFIIPALINIPFFTNLVVENIQNKINIPIKITNPHFKMGMLPSIIITADKIDVINPNNTKVLNIENSYLKIKLLPLIFNNLYVENSKVDNLYVNFNISKNLVLSLGDYNLKDIKFPFKLKEINTNIKQYKIILKNQDSKKITTISSKTALNSTYKLNKEISIRTNTNVKTGKHNSIVYIDSSINLPLKNFDTNKLSLISNIKNLDLSDFSEYIKYFSKGKFQKISGIINLTTKTKLKGTYKNITANIVLDKFGLYQKDNAKSIYFKDRLNINSGLKFNKNSLKIDSTTISGNNISIGLNGKIKNINSQNKQLNINLILNKSRTESLIDLAPAMDIPQINLYLLKRNKLYGDVIGNINITGNTKTPDIIGNILITNSYLIKPIKNAKGAIIKLNFDKNILNMDINVPTSQNQRVTVKGPAQLYNDKYVDLQIKSTNAINLATVEFVLNPLHDILHFIIGPVPIMKISGLGSINLRVTGNNKNPHAFGFFKFYNTTASFNDIHNMNLTNGSGILTFKNTDTEFLTKTATLFGKPVLVKGICNLNGKFDFNIKAKSQNSGNLIKIVKTSPMLKDISNLLSQIATAKGLTNLDLNITGNVKDPKNIKFLKNVFANGNIKLINNDIKLFSSLATLNNINGNVNFKNTNANMNLEGKINHSLLKIVGKIENSNADLIVNSNKFYASDIFAFLPKNIKIPYKNDLSHINTNFVAKYNGSINKINFNNILINGKIYTNKNYSPELLVNNSYFTLNKSKLRITNLQGKIKNYPYFISVNAKNVFDKNINFNGSLKIKQLNIALITDFLDILPSKFSTAVKDYKDIEGTADLSAKIVNNKIKAYTNLDNISFYYIPKKMKFSIISGNLFMNDSTVNLNKLNSKLGGMPVFINGKISNLFNNPKLNLYVNAKPSQDFIDSYVNNKMVYPIKIKGDLNMTSYVTGYLKNLNTKSKLSLTPNSSIYYMGSTLGDVENAVEIDVNSNYSKDHIRLNSLQYDKIIQSQNNEPFKKHQLFSTGDIYLLKNNEVRLKNLKVKTQNPTDAKIFNIVFKKPIMKQGIFTTDLIVNGNSKDLKAIGKINVTSVDMPFYNSTIRDISMDLKPEKIYVDLKGEILSNYVNFKGKMQNKLTPPFVVEDVKVKLKDLNIDTITDTLRDYDVESTQNQTSNAIQNLDLSQFVIRNAEVLADKVKAKNISATNFEATGSLNEKMLLNIDNYKFDIAQGKVNGNSYYNLLTHQIGLKMHMENANAQMMSEALFDLKNQIYGSVTGDVDLMCNGKSHKKCMQTFQGDAYFNVVDGKMPKLGSLEYLLKAGNLLTGGFTGLSINSLIDLITPLKTGEFESISGDMHILNGIAQRIDIYSKGKDLNMYMTGAYNFTNDIADMRIFGSLSKNISNVFSKIKNASLNTLFNMIPGISSSENTQTFQHEISKIPNEKNQSNKIFTVDIYGDINGNNYVKSFKWVK